MNKQTARVIADALTWARIVSIVPITVLAFYDLRWWVFGVYIAAALTDLLDGFFARRGAPSQTDVDLDGLADILVGGMTLLWLWMLIPGFFQTYWLPYIPVLVALQIWRLPLRIRYPQAAVPHLRIGRIAMALFFFLLPVLIVWGDVPWFVHLVLIVATVSEVMNTLVLGKRVRAMRARAHPDNVSP